MVVNKEVVGKFLYGTFFCLAVPVVLYWWSTRIEIGLKLPHQSSFLGALILVSGFTLMVMGMWNLWRFGNGLPMNAYPPASYVKVGAYSLFRHPIYFGFCFACAGASLVVRSAPGFYIVTPVVILLCVALVQGYEARDIHRRFHAESHEPFFALPLQRELTRSTRLATFICAFIPWLVLYELVIYLGASDIYLNSMMPWEYSIPVIEFAELPYALAYIFVGMVPFIIPSTSQMRRFVIDSWLITMIGIFLQCILPVYTSPRTFEPTNFFGELHMFERSLDGVAAAFPSFHVMWSLLAMRSWISSMPRASAIFKSLAFLIVVSCVLTGVHSILDVLAGIGVYKAVEKKEALARYIRNGCENLANSWRARHIGPLRIINHSLYAGVAAFAGIFTVAQLGVGISTLLMITCCSMVGGAVWAQLIEGSKRMLRPFGFYGGLIGGVIGIGVSTLFFHADVAATFAAFAVGATITQALGRLRCFVQGCCHGRAVDRNNTFGIHYINSHSRVCLSGLKGITVYNTQLYSIFANAIIGMVLIRLVYANVDVSLITGLFFILSGVARFIEEGYRGEIQTRKVKGLSLYQTLAIASVVTGIVISSFTAGKKLQFTLVLTWEVFLVAAISGLIWAFAMGMDFPKSSARFARLTG